MPSQAGTSAAFFRCKPEAQLLRAEAESGLDFLPRHDGKREQLVRANGNW
jgi:hypothetical protein